MQRFVAVTGRTPYCGKTGLYSQRLMQRGATTSNTSRDRSVLDRRMYWRRDQLMIKVQVARLNV